MTTGMTVMSGELGDIFWDLAPWITYEPGYDLGCSIYVANISDTEKEFSLIARLTQGSVVISEEALPVFGNSWFKVAPGDFVRLKGALRFDDSDCELSILLVERETEEIADSVVTVLVSPESAGALPPSWPGTSTSTTSDMSTMMAMMLPIMMIGMIGAVANPRKEKKTASEKETVKMLPPGRRE
ncbi:MAG: hypothetical protein WC455_20915 [Dehalococcoidia bacterium]|jgi:hypothetical protein